MVGAGYALTGGQAAAAGEAGGDEGGAFGRGAPHSLIWGALASPPRDQTFSHLDHLCPLSRRCGCLGEEQAGHGGLGGASSHGITSAPYPSICSSNTCLGMPSRSPTAVRTVPLPRPRSHPSIPPVQASPAQVPPPLPASRPCSGRLPPRRSRRSRGCTSRRCWASWGNGARQASSVIGVICPLEIPQKRGLSKQVVVVGLSQHGMKSHSGGMQCVGL